MVGIGDVREQFSVYSVYSVSKSVPKILIKISALRWCCPVKFLYALEIDQALMIAQTQMGMGVPQKTFDCENLKFYLKFSVLAPVTLGLVGVSSQPDDVMNFGPQTKKL